ncbi:PAS domain S-box-containing protein [Prosthecobacter debontii]|uniref:histidine kinase n=1 Tax=Prosthecobacter debontii TaxID=48467 RepID=A0A1T4WU38_9BACT|nr:PAS domain S-box protein [Prosthecobacter debontii]SKA80378.1 PAS domain S-box-containing protein [Prosthecobacter debontii]
MHPFFEQTTLVALAIDASRNLIHASSAASRVLGYSTSELLQRPFISLLQAPSSITPAVFPHELTQVSPTQPTCCDLTLICRDGRPLPASFSVSTYLSPATGSQHLLLLMQPPLKALTQQVTSKEELFLRASLNALPIGLAVLDGDGVIVITNKAWGQPENQAVLPWTAGCPGDNYLDLCEKIAASGSEPARNTLDQVRSVLVGQLAEACIELSGTYQDEERNLLCKATRFQNHGPVHVAITHEDITAMRQTQRRAERNRQQFQDLFECAPDAMVMTNAEGLITLVNRQAEQLFGYQRDELIGQPVEILMQEQTRRSHVGLRQQYLASAIPRPMGVGRSNLKGRKRDGSVFHVDISLSPMQSDHGPQVVAAVRDITERVQAESQVRQALAMLNATDDGAFIFQPETLAFIFVNEGATRQLQYNREELLGMTALDILPEYDEPRLRSLLQPLLTGEKTVRRVTTQHRTRSGSQLPVEISLQVVTTEEGQRRCIAIARDITERLQRERKERRTQRLESIGTLAGGVAHDLNNALTPVLMICDLLKERYPEAAELLHTAESGAQRGADMVRHLLTFSRGVEGERQPVSLSDLFNEIAFIINGTFPKNIQLHLQHSPGLNLVLGDPTQLHQVILNLCVNARDAMPTGGSLKITAENIQLHAPLIGAQPESPAGSYIVCQISDTGLGIQPELLDRIFEPFFSTKGPDRGTGLGLSTALGIIRSHGGFIRVESTPGQGSTFSIYLPEAPLSSDFLIDLDPPPAPASSSDYTGQGQLILIVDDEPAVRDTITTVLTALNYRVLAAADGTEAIIHAVENKDSLHAVITDLHMPEMDGLNFVRALRRIIPTTRVIVASGRFEPPQVQQFELLGHCTLLPKPFTQPQLLEALHHALHASV